VRRAGEREGALHLYHGSICCGECDLEPGAARCQTKGRSGGRRGKGSRRGLPFSRSTILFREAVKALPKAGGDPKRDSR
jgi:hypothetical protein